MKHFDNDYFKNTSTMITLLPFLGVTVKHFDNDCFENTSTLITALLFEVVTVKHFDNDCFETFLHGITLLKKGSKVIHVKMFQNSSKVIM